MFVCVYYSVSVVLICMRVGACVSSFACVRLGIHNVCDVCMCILCIWVYTCVYACVYVYIYGVCMYMGVCSCEFVDWVACCSVSDPFGEIRTHCRRLEFVLVMDPIH